MNTQEGLETEFKEFLSRDSSPYFFYIHNSEGIFTYLSENITQLLGFSPEEFQTDYLKHITANPINKDVIKYTDRCIQGIQQEPYRLEIYDKKYNKHSLYVFEKPIFKDEKVIGVKGVAKLLS